MLFSKRISGNVATVVSTPLVKGGGGLGCGAHFVLSLLSSPFRVKSSNLFRSKTHTGNYLSKNTLSASSCLEAYSTCLSTSVLPCRSHSESLEGQQERRCSCTSRVGVRASPLPSPLFLEQRWPSVPPQSPQKDESSRCNQSYSSLLLPCNSYSDAEPAAVINKYGGREQVNVDRLGLRLRRASAWGGGVFAHRKTFAMAESVRSFCSSTSQPLFTPNSNCGQKRSSGSNEGGGGGEREDTNAAEKTSSHHEINLTRGSGDAVTTEAAKMSECEVSDRVVVPRREGYYMLSSLRCIPSNDAIDPACYSILTCRGSGPGGQGANSSSSKVELRVDLGILELYLEECIENDQMGGEVRGPPGFGDSHAIPNQREKRRAPQGSTCHSSTCVAGDGDHSGDESIIGGEMTGEAEEEENDADGGEFADPDNNAHFSPPSSSSISMAERFTDEVISDPEAYLHGLAPHKRIVAKIKAKLPMILKHGGGRGGGGALDQDQSSTVCPQTTTTIKGPAAELVSDRSILILMCNQHRSNRQNIGDCLTKLREIIFEASYVMPTETTRNKSYRASHHAVNKAKLKRQAGSNKRRAMAKVRKGLW